MVRLKNKKSALELSIGTIVILVIAMSMLILGLILVRTIFSGASENVKTMNDKVRDEIHKLFVEGKLVVMYLSEQKAVIKQGSDFGIGFGIKNEGQTQEFKWSVKVADDNIRKKCGVNEGVAEGWVTTGGTGKVAIPSGDEHYDTIRFNIPKAAVNDISTCIIRYNLVVKNEDNTPYDTVSFDVDVK